MYIMQRQSCSAHFTFHFIHPDIPKEMTIYEDFTTKRKKNNLSIFYFKDKKKMSFHQEQITKKAHKVSLTLAVWNFVFISQDCVVFQLSTELQ